MQGQFALAHASPGSWSGSGIIVNRQSDGTYQALTPGGPVYVSSTFNTQVEAPQVFNAVQSVDGWPDAITITPGSCGGSGSGSDAGSGSDGSGGGGSCIATLTTAGFSDLDCSECSTLNGTFLLSPYPAGTYWWQGIAAWISNPISLSGVGTATGPCGVYVWVLASWQLSLLDVNTGNGVLWSGDGVGPGLTGTYTLDPTSFSSCSLPSTVTVDCDCCS